MPRRSKKHIQPTFSKTKKKTKDLKRNHMEKVQDLVDQFQYIFVFHCENFRNDLMKKVKEELNPSVFFMGKIAPTIVALGKTKDSEFRENLNLLCECLQKEAKGSARGLYFTNSDPSNVEAWFNKYETETVPKTGFVATQTFVIPKGALNSTQFNHSQEYQLRQLGLLVQLKHGQLLLEKDFVVCKRGDILKPEQCRLLGLWNQKQAKFRFVLHGYWTNEQFVRLGTGKEKTVSTDNVKEQEEEKFIQSNNEDYDTFGNTMKDQIGRSDALFANLLSNKNGVFGQDDDQDDDEDEDAVFVEDGNDHNDVEIEDNDVEIEDDNDDDNEDNIDDHDSKMKGESNLSKKTKSQAIDDALFLEE